MKFRWKRLRGRRYSCDTDGFQGRIFGVSEQWQFWAWVVYGSDFTAAGVTDELARAKKYAEAYLNPETRWQQKQTATYRVGRQMSNVLFNLAQHPQFAEHAATFRDLRQQWDEVQKKSEY